MTIACTLPVSATHRPLSARVRASIDECAQSLRALSPRATARTLDAAYCAATVVPVEVRRALDMAGPGDVWVRGAIYGGFVPNSYAYSADTDICLYELQLDPDTGKPAQGARIKITLDRVRAQTRAGGRGSTTITRIVKVGQKEGRII
jgi:hypothetical protein